MLIKTKVNHAKDVPERDVPLTVCVYQQPNSFGELTFESKSSW